MTLPKAICDPSNPDCTDKNSAHYFFCHMTEEDWQKKSGWSQLRKDHELLYQFNRVNTPSAEAESFSRLRGLLLVATHWVWRGLLGIGYPGYLFREPNFKVLLQNKSEPARK